MAGNSSSTYNLMLPSVYKFKLYIKPIANTPGKHHKPIRSYNTMYKWITSSFPQDLGAKICQIGQTKILST